MNIIEPVDKSITSIITALQKPLTFAAKDNFAHLHSLKNMESLVKNLCNKALLSHISADELNYINELQEVFEGFDDLSIDKKKERVIRGIEIADGMQNKDLSACSAQADSNRTLQVSLNNTRLKIKKLSTPVEYVKGVGPKVGEWFRKKGVETVFDLLYFLPFRYEDRRHIKKIAGLAPGSKEVAKGIILALGEVFYGRKKVFEIALSDKTGVLKLKWFNYRAVSMKKRYRTGQEVIVFGSIGVFGGQKEIIHPDIEILDENNPPTHPSDGYPAPFDKGGANGGFSEENFNAIVSVYSSVGNLHQKTIRKILKEAVTGYAHFAVSGIPFNIMKKYGIMNIPLAIKECHLPGSTDCIDVNRSIARESLVFDELFCLELGLAIKRKETAKEGGISFKTDSPLVDKFKVLLPFRLTQAQERVLSEIKNDMTAPHPMNRLLQGDVGSGKTAAATISALIAIDNNYQAAIMAPTEILAEQHYLNIHGFADKLGIRVSLLTSSTPKHEKREIIEGIRNGDVNLIIGTHALIQEDIEFNRLGIAIIDEQHRFGVVQRAALKKKGRGANPDILVMTATPIPRTLSMTVFGDLDISIIDELPPGRIPVETSVFRERDRDKVYRILRGELEKGRQGYIVYPLIEENEDLDLRDATNMAQHLQNDIFPDYKIGLMHGRLSIKEKEGIMNTFKNKDIDLLVSTTVIEVGIDVPNATVMVVEHAERFGLSQLHQLRGRVGRGEYKSFCFLFAYKVGSVDTYRRLKIMEETNDGFKIAEEDLNIRGPGDFIGTRQSGLPDLRVSDILHDASILKKARDEAFKLIENETYIKGDEYKILKELINARWKGRFELAEVG